MEERMGHFLALVTLVLCAGSALAGDKVVQKSRMKREIGRCARPPIVAPNENFVTICFGVTTNIDQESNPFCDRIRLAFGNSVPPKCECEWVTNIAGKYQYGCAEVILKGNLGLAYNEDAVRVQFESGVVVGYLHGTLDVQGFMVMCKPGWNLCHADSLCSPRWGNYDCKCRDDYEDMVDSDSDSYHFGDVIRKGTNCKRREGPKGDPSPIEDLDLWMYILIALAVGVLLLLLLCCCCYCSPYGKRVRKKVRHVKVIHSAPPAPAPCAPAPCLHPPMIQPPMIQPAAMLPQILPSCNPGSVTLHVEEKEEHLKVVPKPTPYGDIPGEFDHSAFIANSGFDGNVYVANPDDAPRQLPWASGTTVEYATLPQEGQFVTATGSQYMTTTEPQQIQILNAADPQFMTTTEPQQIQILNATEPQFMTTTEPQQIQILNAADPQFVTANGASSMFAPQDQGVYQQVQTLDNGNFVMLQ